MGFTRNKIIKINNIFASKLPEYKIWQNMKTRCFSKNSSDYKRYGSRGITVCDEWLNSFENFYRDMGKRSSDKHSLDRIDNNGNYCKENCRWATIDEQANNKRSNILLTVNNVTLNISQWCKLLGLKNTTVEERFKRGWSHEKCLKIINKK